MKVFIRADASVEIGSGHVMRCLTLAQELQGLNAQVSFICKDILGNLIYYIESKGFKVYRIEMSANEIHHVSAILSQHSPTDWLVVDHYSLNAQWERAMQPYCRRILVIDDLANREHDCDILLDQNYYESPEHRYDALVPKNTKVLIGPQFALLRKEFREARKTLRERDGTFRRILVFFGGSDPTNETIKALKAIQLIDKNHLIVDVVVGGSNPNQEEIAELCSTLPNFNYYCQVENMAELMVRADLALGAGGATTWERSYLGLPTLVVVLADNQKELTAAIARKEVILNLGWHSEVLVQHWLQAMKLVMSKPLLLKRMSENALALMGNPTYSIARMMQDIVQCRKE
jgi:UDP-2,4-diacetamido-2,4,6-trideoxy-beta-L-altropyranose hydrolase